MMTPGKSTAVNACTFVFTPESRSFIALMAGPFCLQLTAMEALTLSALMRMAADDVRECRPSSRLTQIRLENWSVVSAETGAVALLRKAVMIRFTPDEADTAARLFDEAADAMNPHRFGEVAHA